MTRKQLVLLFTLPLLGALAITGIQTSDRSGTYYGDAVSLGDGTIRTFVTRNAGGRPLSTGLLLSEAALNNLPMDLPAMGPAHETVLTLPRQARGLPFDHISVDWNPMGHEPEGMYTQPHFDFHFYMMTEDDRSTIDPMADDFEAKATRQPDAAFLPVEHVMAPGAVPRMGNHWIAATAPELNGQPFSATFIYGTWDGKVTFLEPMITKAYIESVRDLPGQVVQKVIPQPAAVQRSGYYPTTYSVQYDATEKTYAFVLDGLTPRTASTG